MRERKIKKSPTENLETSSNGISRRRYFLFRKRRDMSVSRLRWLEGVEEYKCSNKVDSRLLCLYIQLELYAKLHIGAINVS